LLRVKGALLILLDANSAVPAAQDHFRQALDWARRQGALSWELRAACSLASLLVDQGIPLRRRYCFSRSTAALQRVSTPPIGLSRNGF
jgi:hypothetical protein